VTPGDPADNNNARVPEDYNVVFPFPIASSGTGGEPAQVCNDGVDDDGDTLVDLLDSGCKPPDTLTMATADTDGDGFSDEAEVYLGTDALGRCELGGPAISSDLPADVAGGAFSADKVNVQDLGAYTVSGARIINTKPGDANFNKRFDVVPGKALAGNWINVQDLSAIRGNPLWNGPKCSAHPTLND
jgi:hypothetical protein